MVLTWLMMARWPYITHCLVAESSGNTLRSGMRAPTTAALTQRPHWVAWRKLTGVVFVPECEHKCAVGQQREAAGLLQVSGHEPWGGTFCLLERGTPGRKSRVELVTVTYASANMSAFEVVGRPCAPPLVEWLTAVCL